MSKQRYTEAILKGFDGPFFPPPIDQLMEAKERLGNVNGMNLDVIGRRVEGFSYCRGAQTSDVYSWFWALLFKKGEGEVAVLFPWAQDWDKVDGTQSDRSIAVYTQEVDEQAANLVLQELTASFQQERQIRIRAAASPR